VILVNIRKILCLLLALTMLVLCGCDMIPSAGSNNIKVDDVKKIIITNGMTSGNTFTVEDRDSIRTIINQINGFTLENGTDPWKGWRYNLSILDANDGELMSIIIVDEECVTANGKAYAVNAKRLLNAVEKLECDTMTDEELLRTLFEGNYFDDVSILNEDGAVSLDKILSIKNDCPALFELLSRPSAISSLGTYGIDMLEEYLNSEDSNLRQKAQEIAEVLKNFFPSIKDKIEEISKK
jgi:hypothetical protein